MVDTLDDLGNEPWMITTLTGLDSVAEKYPQWRDDFERRVGVLKTIRQQFLAFIVDEYQDTNPAHFRLLSELWGSRNTKQTSDSHGMGSSNLYCWRYETSIYRFRQAEVTVIRRTVEHIKRMNEIEFANGFNLEI